MKKSIAIALSTLVFSSSLFGVVPETTRAAVPAENVVHIDTEEALAPELNSDTAGDKYVLLLEEVEDKLINDPDNPILLMQKNMLLKKTSKAEPESTRFSHTSWRSTPTGLTYETHGGFASSFRTLEEPSFEMLTGQLAMDESLQLDSIGSTRGNDPHEQLLVDVRNSIEAYKQDVGEYPSTLADFKSVDGYYKTVWWEGEMQNINDLADLFSYAIIKEATGGAGTTPKVSFSLKLNKQSTVFSVDDVEPVEIESHPWEEMLGTTEYTVPEIANIVPADMFFVYFDVPEKMLELESILLKYTEQFGDLYSLGDLAQVKPRLMQRLHIPDMDQLIYGVSEIAFISDDLSFDTKTDFALVVKFKNDIAKMGFSFLDTDEVLRADIGDYTVIASSQAILDRAQKAYATKNGSIGEQKDFHYMLTALEERRAGLVYFSESFIRKLTGPAYRINAARRNSVIEALETLQYAVFAYRAIEGEWPESFSAMTEEGFIDDNTIFEARKYDIDNEGRVTHDDWGSLWDIKPINQVPISNITYAEKMNYKNFSDGYQNFFQQFFDPIGIAITVSDQVMFHTIILPLINESEYDWWQTIVGSSERPFSHFENPDRVGAVNVASKFSVDDILDEFGREELIGEGAWLEQLSEDEQRHVSIVIAEYEIATMMDIESELVTSMDEVEDMRDNEEEFVPALLDVAYNSERMFDFIGNEVFLGVGDENSFEVNNIADIDVWLGVELKDREKAEEFIKQLYTQLMEYADTNMGMLSISSDEPVKNEYNGLEYYMIPTGFVNIYYMFFDDVMYVAVSQKTINKLIDSTSSDENASFSSSELRGMDFIGLDHDMMGIVDLTKVTNFSFGNDREGRTAASIAMIFEMHRAYFNELLELAKLLPEYNGSLSNISSYISTVPSDFLGMEYIVENGVVYIVADDEKIDISRINHTYNSRSPNYGKRYDDEDTQAMDLSTLVDTGSYEENFKESINAFRSLAVGAQFTDEGFDVRLAIGNPLVAEDEIVTDERFEAIYSETVGESQIQLWHYILIVLVVIVLLILVLKRLLRDGEDKNKKSVHIYHGMKFHPDNSDEDDEEEMSQEDRGKKPSRDSSEDKPNIRGSLFK